MKPYGDRVLVRLLPPKEQTTKAGIILTTPENKDTVLEQPRRGEVVSSNIPRLSEGFIVVFSRVVGTTLKHHGEPHILLNEDHILAVEDQ